MRTDCEYFHESDDGGHKRLVTVSGMDGLHRFADYPFLSDSYLISDSDFGIKN